MEMESVVKAETFETHVPLNVTDRENIFFASTPAESDETASSDPFKLGPEFSHTSLFPMMSLLLSGSQYYDKPFYDMSISQYSSDIKTNALPAFNFAKISTITDEIKTESTYTSPPIHNNNSNKEESMQKATYSQLTVIPEDDAKNCAPTVCQEKQPNKLSKRNSANKGRKRKANNGKDGSECLKVPSEVSVKRSKKSKSIKIRTSKKPKKSDENGNEPVEGGDEFSAALEMGVLLVKSCLESICNATDDEDDDADDGASNCCSDSSSSPTKGSSDKTRRRGKNEVNVRTCAYFNYLIFR